MVIFYVELYLDGLYYRVKYYKDYHMLGFILGYNHYISYKLPLNISVIVHMKRRRFFLLSFDYLLLNINANELVNLKYPNIYLGKGLRIRSKLYRKKPVIKKAYR
jgi:ribosomal protein L6P/L9E